MTPAHYCAALLRGLALRREKAVTVHWVSKRLLPGSATEGHLRIDPPTDQPFDNAAIWHWAALAGAASQRAGYLG